MKKLSILLISTFILQLNVFSQTVLNFNTHAPLAGDEINFLEVPFFEPGQGGKDKVWDFSKITTLPKTVVSKQHRPENEAVDKFILKPNIVLSEDEKNNYFNLNESTYELVGVITDKYNLVYDKPVRKITYPFMYEDYIEGNFTATAKYETNYNIEITGRYNTEADAFGLLLLPGNRIKNVLRVKQYTHSVQTSMCSVVEVDAYKYVWYSFDERYPLISVIITEQRFSNGETKLIQEAYINEKLYTCTSDNMLANGEANNDLFNYSVFPNPFKNDINISYQLNKDLKVTVGIYDMLGKRVKDIVLNENQNSGLYSYTVGASEIGLTPGMYFIKFEFGNKVVIEKITRSH